MVALHGIFTPQTYFGIVLRSVKGDAVDRSGFRIALAAAVDISALVAAEDDTKVIALEHTGNVAAAGVYVRSWPWKETGTVSMEESSGLARYRPVPSKSMAMPLSQQAKMSTAVNSSRMGSQTLRDVHICRMGSPPLRCCTCCKHTRKRRENQQKNRVLHSNTRFLYVGEVRRSRRAFSAPR